MMDDECARAQMDRRGFIKTIGASAAAVGAVGMGANEWDNGPLGTAQALLPLAPIGIAAGGAALGYLIETGVDKILGNDQDLSGFTGEDALHAALYEASVQMMSADERVLTSIENNIINSENVALAKGKAALIEEMNIGSTEGDATSAMQAAIDDYYSVIETNILQHWNSQAAQVGHMYDQATGHDTLSRSAVWSSVATASHLGNGTLAGYTAAYSTYETLDGTVLDVDRVELTAQHDTSGTFTTGIDPVNYTSGGSGDPVEMHVDAYSGSMDAPDEGSFQMMNAVRYDTLLTDLRAARDNVNTNLTGFVSDVYNAYAPGDIPTEDLVDPITASTELRQDYDGYQTQGAHAAMLGIPTASARSVYIELHDDDARVYCDLYTSHVPIDQSGNEVGFRKGYTYTPSAWDAPLYISYEVAEMYSGTDDPHSTETATATATATPTGTATGTATSGWTSDGDLIGETDFAQIEQDFTVLHAEDRDGNEIETFQTEDTNNQTADVAAIEEELARIREVQVQMQEDAESELNSGGGGGGLSGDIPGWGVAAAIAAVLGLGAASNSGGRR